MIFVTSGGSGGLSLNDAIIHVTSHAGSTITFSKGGVVVKVLGPEKSHINSANSAIAEWYYSISLNNYGAWTVNSSNGQSSTVTIDSAKVYDVNLYETDLYNRGIECSLLTGGWKVVNHTYGNGRKNADNIQLSYYSDNARVSKAYTNGKVDVSNYSVLHLLVNVTASTSNASMFGLSINNTNSVDVNASQFVVSQSFSGTGTKTLVVDISSISGTHYVCVAANIANMYVYRVWLT